MTTNRGHNAEVLRSMKANLSNNPGEPASEGWHLSESTHEYDEQGRLIQSYTVESKNHSGPQEDPAWTRGHHTEGSGFVKQHEYQQDEAGRVSKFRVWTNYPPL